MAKDITIYTSNTCASCRTLKHWLATKNYDYKEVNVDNSPDERQTVFSLTGRAEVPVTVISDERGTSVAVGWKPGEIMAALAS